MPKTPVAHIVKALSADAAAVVMWNYYKENKNHLVDEIRESRDHILSQLMLGHNVAEVFSDFLRPPEPTSTKRKSK